MKKITILLFLLISIKTLGIGQSEWGKYNKIKDVKSNDVKELSEKITGEYTEELDKIKAIYFWVAHNIKYDYAIVEEIKEEKAKREKYTKAALEEKRQEEIRTAIKRKKGVCQHYSLVFEELCLHSEIESKFIGGLVKTKSGRANSHAWNAVKYKDEWQLIDVTFGSGKLDENKKFAFKFDPNYFFVDKEVFKINHFPKDSKWQLSENEIEKEEFLSYLIIGSGYIEYDVKSLNQKEYKVEIKKEKNLVLEFNTSKPIENLICYKPSTGKRVEMKMEEENLNYRIEIEYSKLRSGYFVFTSGKNMLFSYKIEKK